MTLLPLRTTARLQRSVERLKPDAFTGWDAAPSRVGGARGVSLIARPREGGQDIGHSEPADYITYTNETSSFYRLRPLLALAIANSAL
ncbi:hypothetical protein BAUCODRAFT_30480 [Baudoinia panamericana UAMH 10762]|uniref:Uncharacterized protein n=1 Tax=Baudoinia panamericana (strain UAMH 10762) TaxID=717646 RepID=M2MT41_BAUPA|nr:uncharacterized protein BAUCODRAFT_30480 [Baudoinia panamericana UAMH 10762]EMD00032.1 hypothetical protein BAUCODRAFT_30480 [Baudoinia panamericana UAMH 10762]